MSDTPVDKDKGVSEILTPPEKNVISDMSNKTDCILRHRFDGYLMAKAAKKHE